MNENFCSVRDRVRFGDDRPAKVDLAAGTQLFVGLNCFEPGQVQRVHTHAGADKFYFVVSGKARLAAGGTERVVEAGDLVWAPAGVAHGVTEVFERTTLLVGIAPPPR